jgi:hypothetical protein
VDQRFGGEAATEDADDVTFADNEHCLNPVSVDQKTLEISPWSPKRNAVSHFQS